MIGKYESQFRKLRPNAKRLIGGFRDDMGRDLIQIVAPFWSLLGNLLLWLPDFAFPSVLISHASMVALAAEQSIRRCQVTDSN